MTHSARKAVLTRAINSRDPDKVIKVCRDAIAQWDQEESWPDDWHRWQTAFDDALIQKRRATLAA